MIDVRGLFVDSIGVYVFGGRKDEEKAVLVDWSEEQIKMHCLLVNIHLSTPCQFRGSDRNLCSQYIEQFTSFRLHLTTIQVKEGIEEQRTQND